jgi:hypothetical protein
VPRGFGLLVRKSRLILSSGRDSLQNPGLICVDAKLSAVG